MFKKYLLLILIVFLALLLRIYKLDVYPDAIDEDEMSLGYIAYSLSQTGSDEYGHKFPIYFESVGDYKYGLYSYFAALPISVFGLNPFTTRIMSALFGTLSVIGIYFLALEIFNKKTYALASSLVLAVNPTHIHFSRVAYSNIMGAFFAVVSFIFYIRFLKKTDIKNVIFTFVFFFLAIFSYQAYRVILPLGFVLFLLFFKFKNTKEIFIKLGVLLASLIVVLVSFIPSVSRARSQSLINLVNQASLVEDISEDGLVNNNIIVTRVFHNKYLYVVNGIVKRYFSYFNPVFLFSEVNSDSERHSTPRVGLFYLIESALILFAILGVSKYKKEVNMGVILTLIAISPIASSLVLDANSITRSVFLVYSFSLLIGLGIYYLVEIKNYRKVSISILSIVYLINIYYFSHQYLIHKPYHHPWYGDVGLKEGATSVYEKYYDKYDQIVVSGGHYISFLFYGVNLEKITASDVSKSVKYLEVPPNRGSRFSELGKIKFNMPYGCPPIGHQRTLYLCFDYKIPKDARLIDVFRYKDGLPAILLIDFDGKYIGNLPQRLEWDSNSVDNNLILDEKSYWPTYNLR